MATLCELGIRAGAWLAEHTIVAHPIESTWITLALILWLAWLSANHHRI
jgi:hypothetical protein